jgi:hypothetical protein
MILWACNEPIISSPTVDTTPKSLQLEIVLQKQDGPTKFLASKVVLYNHKLVSGFQSGIGRSYWIYSKKY